MKRKCEYFSQITVAFLSSRIQETCILLLRKATMIWPKYSHFRFISICLSDAHPRAGRRSRQSQVRATLSPFHIYLFPAFQGFPYYIQMGYKVCNIVLSYLGGNSVLQHFLDKQFFKAPRMPVHILTKLLITTFVQKILDISCNTVYTIHLMVSKYLMYSIYMSLPNLFPNLGNISSWKYN